MIPRTKHGLSAFAVVSAMQKCIRRGMEAEAMEMFCEMAHSSKAFLSMALKRLEIIAHEDIDTEANPMIVPFVATACAQAAKWYEPDKPGRARMPAGNAIRLMCRAKKSRLGDHFQVAIGLANLLENKVPEIPEWAHDQHTFEGRRMGRGLEHFREHSTKLVPAVPKDDYEDEFYRLKAIEAKAKGKAKKEDVSEDEHA